MSKFGLLYGIVAAIIITWLWGFWEVDDVVEIVCNDGKTLIITSDGEHYCIDSTVDPHEENPKINYPGDEW